MQVFPIFEENEAFRLYLKMVRRKDNLSLFDTMNQPKKDEKERKLRPMKMNIQIFGESESGVQSRKQTRNKCQ